MDISGYALVTGAGSGIGRATAIAFARAGGAGVALLDKNQSAAQTVANEIADQTLPGKPLCKTMCISVDVTDENAVSEAVERVAKEFGRLDHVVNSAGISFKHTGGSAEAETGDWHRVLDINLNGTFYVYRAAAKIMLKQDFLVSSLNQRQLQRGTIVNVSSICGVVGVSMSTAYCASKHAVIGLTRTASEDYASHGLRVNAVCPGYIMTPLITSDPVIVGVAKEKTERWTPMRRLGTADEVADAIIFLSSGQSSYIAGSALMVDGGYTSH